MAAFYDPDGVLIDWKDGPGWTVAEAQAGVLTTGPTGSGKSSGPAAMLRRAFLQSTTSLQGGMGGVVLFAKDEADEWARTIEKAGRRNDIIRVTPDATRWRFNFCDWISQWGSDERGPIPTVSLLNEIATPVKPRGSSGEHEFFDGAFRAKLTNLVHVIQLAGLPVSLPLMEAIAGSEPQTVAEGKDPEWRAASACWAILREAYFNTRHDRAAAQDFAVCKRHFMQSYPSLSFRTRGVIDQMKESLLRPLITRPCRKLLCEDTTFTPEICFDGAIILVDLSVSEFHDTAKLVALAIKRCFQLAVLRRHGPPGSLRPCFLFVDEAQEFLSPLDPDYIARCRSAGGVTCLITQQISSVREAMGNQDRAENLMSNMQTRIFCQCTGETARYASALVGARYKKVSSIGLGHDRPVHPDEADRGSKSTSISRQEEMRSYIEPIEFQRFRRGGKSAGYEVDACVFVGGRTFRGEDGPQPYKIVSFPQEREP